MLQESKWNIDVKNKDGTTPLHAAVRFGHYDVAEYLLSHGANVNYVDKSKSSLLHMVSLKFISMTSGNTNFFIC